ncbi:MAG: hypothetical protein WC223_12175 [Bacteroidales bacterium]|jgi:hypothetical protein
MKTKKEKKEKIFDAVKFMRQVREKISLELVGLTTEQILEYFRNREKKERIMPCR